MSFDQHTVYRGAAQVTTVRELDGRVVVGASFSESLMNIDDVMHLRDVRQLASTSGTSQAILAGTYVTTSDQVRFSIRLIHTSSNEVLAMGTATVPITDDLRPLVREARPGDGLAPSVRTRLQ